MPVRKFRSVEAMEETTWIEPGDPRLPRAIRLCWEMAARLSPVRFPAGVYKHRSIEELNAQTDRWEREARVQTVTPLASAHIDGHKG